MARRPPMNGEQSFRQAFLFGETLYLRPLEPSDAASAPIWNRSPVPRPPEVEHERIEEQLGGDVGAYLNSAILLIRRRTDDRPVGSVSLNLLRSRLCSISFTYDPNASRDEWARVCSQTLSFLIPWLLQERSMMMAYFSFPGEHRWIAEATAALGMRRSFRLRERVPIAGERFDTIGYEALHPDWVARLGTPRGIEEGPEERSVPNAAPRAWAPRYTPPESAIVVGERVYLRAFAPDDAELASRQILEDTEISFPEGRSPVNPYVHARNIREMARQQVPKWFHFAIVLGETGEMIGANGLIEPDLIAGIAETETEIWKPEFRGRGYGTEAKHLLLEYAFDRLNLHMVNSWVSEFNTRSAAALRKQGYRDAGYMAWVDYRGTELYGALMFDLLASEWRAARW
jgi:RimJ/RimL family protein N-acetyltransferase